MKPKNRSDMTGIHRGKKPTRNVARPIRRPVQARGIATVEALIEAAARILSQEDFRQFTTNRVAKVAGVGIGSFYEYFADKDDLLAELTERFAAEIEERVTGTIRALDGADLSAVVEAGLGVVIEIFQSRAALHRRLLEQAPYLTRTNPLTLIEIPIRAAIVQMLHSHADEIIVDDFEVAAINISRICRAMVEAALSDPFMPLELGTVRTELAVIFRRYLTGRA